MNNTYSNMNFDYPVYYDNSSYDSLYSSNFKNIKNVQDDRIIGGGFAFPFLLGGVTGAAIAPAFWRPPYNRPYGPMYGPGFYGPRPF